uniref:Poly [ADP-ribose] polymerase n=1 Tax=Cyprinodon variegatus TaxID=28743 RepID=A0A3Q2CPR0_CYPVA
ELKRVKLLIFSYLGCLETRSWLRPIKFSCLMQHLFPTKTESFCSMCVFCVSASASFSTVSSPSLGVYKMQMGQLTLEVSSGDITKEACDVIVNSSNQNFNLQAGVSKAILDSAGPTVLMECAQMVNSPGYTPRGMIMTTGGLLPSRNIIHVVGQNDAVKIKEIVQAVLKLCEENKFSSVAFPALGTANDAPLPQHWEDMKDIIVKRVPLTAGSQEYKDIERIQNTTLWQSYQLQKKLMEVKNKHTNNEKLLYHGTGATSIDLINSKGFNRSAMYGNGSYFAVDPAYSARGYAKPDNLGHKRMYQARVLIGDYTRGKSGLIAPPAKSGTGADLYDSVTDNANNPSMFIIFHDTQAYPEYLITFT